MAARKLCFLPDEPAGEPRERDRALRQAQKLCFLPDEPAGEPRRLPSITHGTRLLRAAYHRAGIPEYWIVDALGDEIDLAVLVREENEYRRVEPHVGWHASQVFGRSFRLDRQPDAVGNWQYTLAVQAA